VGNRAALLMIGSPMHGSGSPPSKQHRRDRTVVTYDPLGVSRSERTDAAKKVTPEEHTDVLRVAADWMDRSGPSGSACSMSSTST